MSCAPVFPFSSRIHPRRLLAALFCAALLLGCASAQDSTAVPHLVKFSGTIASAPAGTVGAIFALYKDQTGGAPLWQEVQNITVDASGHYSSLLGARSLNGIPPEVFNSGEARWLGVQAEGQPEQARVLLVSVPYALKASDAETLGGLPASAFRRSDAVAVNAPPATVEHANYVNSAAVNAAANKAVAAATAATFTAGYLPVFTDSTGDLGNSLIAQVSNSSGNFVGIGTATPATTLDISGTNPTLRIDNYSGSATSGGDSPNFNFISGNGTASAPLPTQANDNLGQFAAAGYNGSAFPGSKVKVNFIATENWTTGANGTAMTFATTKNGTTSRAERLRIDNTGNVGIGTTAPTSPLTVAGTIRSTSGGFVFPDGSSLATAKTTGVSSVTAGDTSVTVGGTASAPKIAVNTATIQKRVTGSCSVGQSVTSVNANGSVNCAAGPEGPPGPASPVVKDAKGNVLGTLISIGGRNGTDVTIYTKGYFVAVGIAGLFPVTGPNYQPYWVILWSGAACTGTAYLPSYGGSTFTRSVLYSAQANALMVPAGIGVTATDVSITPASQEIAGYGAPNYIYADGVSYCDTFSAGSSSAFSIGWQLVAIDPADTLGWTVSGNPLSVAGPLQLP